MIALLVLDFAQRIWCHAPRQRSGDGAGCCGKPESPLFLEELSLTDTCPSACTCSETGAIRLGSGLVMALDSAMRLVSFLDLV